MIPPGFLRAILSAPGDDTPRLVLADWLEENAGVVPCGHCDGSGEQAPYGLKPAPTKCKPCNGDGTVSDGRRERAKFIRVQVELAKQYAESLPLARGGHITRDRTSEETAIYLALRERERELLTAHRDVWWPLSGIKPHHGFGNPPSGSAGVLFRRGFVAELTCPAEMFLGGVCEVCGGSGGSGEDECGPTCSDCKGEGRTPGIAESLVWSPGQTVACPECSDQGRPGEYRYRSETSAGWKKCPPCSGTGRFPNPDPPPATAQPVEKVVLTTTPGLLHAVNNTGEPQEVQLASGIVLARLAPGEPFVLRFSQGGPDVAMMTQLLEMTYPGLAVTFALPPPA